MSTQTISWDTAQTIDEMRRSLATALAMWHHHDDQWDITEDGESYTVVITRSGRVDVYAATRIASLALTVRIPDVLVALGLPEVVAW